MSIENMTTTIDRLLDKEVGNGASIEAVEAAKKSLGVRFPNDYEAFLYKYGWARVLYDEFYGVGGSIPEHLDLVVNAERERRAFRPYLPNYLIPVMPDGAGNHYCIDTSRIADGTCPIVFWDHDFDESQTPEIVGTSFSEWIVEHVTEQIA